MDANPALTRLRAELTAAQLPRVDLCTHPNHMTARSPYADLVVWVREVATVPEYGAVFEIEGHASGLTVEVHASNVDEAAAALRALLGPPPN